MTRVHSYLELVVVGLHQKGEIIQVPLFTFKELVKKLCTYMIEEKRSSNETVYVRGAKFAAPKHAN